MARFNTPKPRTYILKPDTGSMGRGVVLVQTSEEVKNAMKGLHGANFVAQKYLTKPMLLNGYKFDLRIYVLILSCNPLRLYLYREGLARFCTEKYMKPDHKNIKVSRMHLTNYSLNKYSSKFEFNSSTTEVNKGSKWTLTALFKALAAEGFDTNQLYAQIKRMVVLTIIAIVPVLAHSYKTCLNEDDNGRSCFELLGLDVLVDEKCKPWLLEVNHSPSFSIDTPLDYMVKEALILDTLKLVNIDPTGMSKVRMEERRDSQLRLYGKLVEECEDSDVAEEVSTKETRENHVEGETRGSFDMIYPTEEANLQKFYDRCLAGASELFTHSFDMKVKKEIAKVQEEKRQEEVVRQEAEKRRAELELRKRAREAAKNVAILRKEALSQRAAAAAAAAAAATACRVRNDGQTATTTTTTMTATTTTTTRTTTVKRSSSRLGKKSPSPTVSLVSMAMSLVGSPITSPATSTPKSRAMEVEEEIVQVEVEEAPGDREESVQRLVELFDEIPERVGGRRPDSASARSSAVDEATTTLNDILFPRVEAQPCPKIPIHHRREHSSELETTSSNSPQQQQHDHILGFGSKTISDFFTTKKLKGSTIGQQQQNHHHHHHHHHHRHQHDHQDHCFTTRGYVKSVSGLPAETKCAHCQRHQGRALALKNANALPMTLHEMTTLASSFLTHRWEHDRSSAKSMPLKKTMGVSESMKAQFRSKLLNFQRTGGFLANPSLLKPLQRMPWDASTNSNRHRQKLNIMLETTQLAPS